LNFRNLGLQKPNLYEPELLIGKQPALIAAASSEDEVVESPVDSVILTLDVQLLINDCHQQFYCTSLYTKRVVRIQFHAMLLRDSCYFLLFCM